MVVDNQLDRKLPNLGLYYMIVRGASVEHVAFDYSGALFRTMPGMYKGLTCPYQQRLQINSIPIDVQEPHQGSTETGQTNLTHKWDIHGTVQQYAQQSVPLAPRDYALATASSGSG